MTRALGGDKAELTPGCGTGFPVAAVRRQYLRRSKTANDKASLPGCCKSASDKKIAEIASARDD